MPIFYEVIERWYSENKRDLPWRTTTDPYKIWISEIILQQTRVKQGYEYFLRFIEYYPSIESLANASEDEVMKLWQGLGYYSRARNILFTARFIYEKYGGLFPNTYKEVRELKGIGEYTAAAICSFAFNMPYAVVDGNVYRVLARWRGIDIPIDKVEGKKFFKSLAQELLDNSSPAIYNQAIMDFGAIQCTPVNPNCSICPLKNSCIAYSNGMVAMLPCKSTKIKLKERYFNYIFIRMNDFSFLKKRSNNDIWRSLYEFPMIETNKMVEESEFYTYVKSKFRLDVSKCLVHRCLEKKLKTVLSHQIIYITFYEFVIEDNIKAFEDYEKVAISLLKNFPVPRFMDNFFKEFIFNKLDRIVK